MISGDESVRGNISGPELLGPGSKFRMNMKVVLPYRITSKVVEFDEDRVIAWCHFSGHRWRWELEPVGDGRTRLTETFDQSTAKAPFLLRAIGYPKRHLQNVANLRRQRCRSVRRPSYRRGMTTSPARVPYDEFAYFADNAAEFGIAFDGPPNVRRTFVEVAPARRISALVWGSAPPELVLIHGGAQNAHTWDTVALALDRPLVAVDLPGHGHSDAAAPGAGHAHAESLAADVGVAIAALAPDAAAVVGMSLGGLTAIALADTRPELVRRLVLVDITPGVDRDKAKAITDFVRGPATFASFDEILARTIEHNPTRTRGVAAPRHPAQRRAARRRVVALALPPPRRRSAPMGSPPMPTSTPRRGCGTPSAGVGVPVMLARGMRAQSVVDDADEAELRRRLPDVRVEHFAEAGHSVQGDMPVELAAAIADFVDDTTSVL